MEKKSRQRIRYLYTADGVRLAWAEAGHGPLLVKAANWLTHLEYDWESPVWRHWIRFLADHFRVVRYDERGCGMTDWNVGDLSYQRWVEDLEAVADTAAGTAPMILLGISQGAAVCIDYAVRHPERVSHLLLYGGYARGIAHRADPTADRVYAAIIELARLGWGTDNPAFRQVFTSRFIPDGTDEQIGWFNELCRKTTSPEIAGGLLQARAQIDVVDLLPRVRTPTLVLHARQDAVTPLDEGRRLAAGIPGAQFVELDSRNHILLEGEPAWDRFREAVLDFVGMATRRGEDPAFAALSPREREILGLVTEGLANAQIAERLALSEKPYATTSRTCSTSSECGRAPRPSSSPVTAGSGLEGGAARAQGFWVSSKASSFTSPTPGAYTLWLTSASRGVVSFKCRQCSNVPAGVLIVSSVARISTRSMAIRGAISW